MRPAALDVTADASASAGTGPASDPRLRRAAGSGQAAVSSLAAVPATAVEAAPPSALLPLPWYCAPASVLDELGIVPGWRLRQAALECVLFFALSLPCAAWALFVPAHWGALFLPLLLCRCPTALMLDLLLLMTGKAACESAFLSRDTRLASGHLVPVTLRALDGLGVLLAFVAAGAMAAVRALLPALQPTPWAVFATPIWVASIVQLVVLVLACAGCASATMPLDPLGQRRRRPRSRAQQFWAAFGWRALFLLQDGVSVPVVLYLDSAGVSLRGAELAVLLCVLMAAAALAALPAAALLRLHFEPTYPYTARARVELRRLSWVLLLLTAALTGGALLVLSALDAHVRDGAMAVPAFLAGATLTTSALLALSALLVCCLSIPHWRTAYCAAHGLPSTPDAVERAQRDAERMQHAASVTAAWGRAAAAQQRYTAGGQLPTTLIKVARQRYRLPRAEDDMELLRRTVLPDTPAVATQQQPTATRAVLQPQAASSHIDEAVATITNVEATPPHAHHGSGAAALGAPPAVAAGAVGSSSLVAAADLCSICCEKPATGVFLDCGHGGVCFECCSTVQRGAPPGWARCPFCRQAIAAIARIAPPSTHASCVVGIEELQPVPIPLAAGAAPPPV